ncbi:MAG: hypothetical protein ABH803_03630 [Candidatus Micrarchaeota archaeon]
MNTPNLKELSTLATINFFASKKKPVYLVKGLEVDDWPELADLKNKYGVKAILDQEGFKRLKGKEDSDFFFVSRGGIDAVLGVPSLYKFLLRGLNSLPKRDYALPPQTIIEEKMYSAGLKLPVQQPEKIVLVVNPKSRRQIIKLIPKSGGKQSIIAVNAPKPNKPIAIFSEGQRVLLDSKQVVGFLKKHGKVFVKAEGVHAGSGIAVLYVNPVGGVYGVIPSDRFPFKKEVIISNKRNIYINVPKFIRSLAKKNNTLRMVVEQGVRGELLGNFRKVEVRFILEDVSKKRLGKSKSSVLGDYCKLGFPNSEFGNIRFHGTSAETKSLFVELYKKRFPELSTEELEKKVKATYYSFRKAALQVSNHFQGVHSSLHEEGKTRKPKFFAVDLMPTFNNKTGLLEPFLMEVHSQAGLHVIGMSGLKDVNPAAFNQISKKMKKHTLSQLEYLLKEHSKPHANFLFRLNK